MTDLIRRIRNLDKCNMLVIPICDNDKRKKLHQFIESEIKINKHSLSVKCFDRLVKFKFKECFNCNKQTLLHYKLGTEEENNKDERYSASCNGCGESVVYEPAYHEIDSVINHFYNNCIVIGELGYNKPSHAVAKYIENYPDKFDIFEIKLPNIILSKINLSKYINDQITKLNK